ncbi:hypothetical protein [uncultured Thiodictyon sp.]|uniref:DUF3024 domain-containing protein n=1 Tax=uncultured Thiodictyon sp. TaxID=1846217 RepID=UPI0025EA1E53|nr:hypothetical protein [uncultured Thiodictyon sp.]
MAKKPKMWVSSPPRAPAPKVPPNVITDVQQKAAQCVETQLKPKHIQAPPAPDAAQYNYLVDIDTKWYRHYFYFCAKYCSPGPNAIAPFFETKFARLEYTGADRFTLSFMRYTDEWVELQADLSIEECLASIQDDPLFNP